MDGLTPSVVSAQDLLNGTKCDGTEITKNLFKDHKPSLIGGDHKRQKLETYLRIRSLDTSSPEERKKYYQLLDNNTLLAIPPKEANASKEGAKRFNFSKIFEEKADQSFVYESCGQPIVKRFLGGQNGLLFAYGITSSGKSYTMRGTTEKPGIIPRALNSIFEVIGAKIEKEVPQLRPESFTKCSLLSPNDRMMDEEIRQFIFQQNDRSYEMQMNSFRSQISVINESSNPSLHMDEVLHSTFRSEASNIKCSVWISFYEIYNEELKDLLELDIEGEKKRKPKIFKDESDNYFVNNLRQICVSSAEQAYKVLLFGQNNLHISSTDLNKNSSRSHCAFNISMIITSSLSKRSTFNMNHLSICDLAGAERSEKANNTGDRIREAGKINGSLLSLSRVISAVRHNQKFEHDQSKQRFVNYRDSKLTKVFQPFFCGNGVAAMVSTMNPSSNLFDETFFALKFTGVASQLVVSSEDQRNKFHDSLKRLTQLWMQSSQRWSNFAHLQPPKPSVSIIHPIKEEDECESNDNQFLDLTVEDMEKKIDEITHMDLSRADPQEIDMLRSQIDFLVEKLKQTENDKMEMEMEVRQQVVSEFNKMIADMEEMANNKDRAKKKLEEMMTQRLINSENLYKKEKLELEHKINSLETENFRITEQLCLLREELKDLKESKEKCELKIIELIDSSNKSQDIDKSVRSICTSPIAQVVKDANTSVTVSLSDANTSVINFDDHKDANTSAIDFNGDSLSIQTCDEGIGTSMIAINECETSTSGLNEIKDQMTNTSIVNYSEKCVGNTSPILCQDKETATECPDVNEDKALRDSTEMIHEIDETVLFPQEPGLSKLEHLKLLEHIKDLEDKVKEKEAMIEFNKKITNDRDVQLKEIQEENAKLKERTNLDFNFPQILKHSSKPSSIAGSSVTSKSVASEDTVSITSRESVNDAKPKKTAKYSSRKRKPNADTSLDKRYLNSINDSDTSTEEQPPSSQASVESCADEIGNNVFSTKKNRKQKRKADSENEEYKPCKGPESKRKRPPLKNLCCSPISPCLSGERVTRSRARKNLF